MYVHEYMVIKVQPPAKFRTVLPCILILDIVYGRGYIREEGGERKRPIDGGNSLCV